MMLRFGLEQLLPLHDGEKRLSDEARSVVHDGSYWRGQRIVGAEETDNENPSSKDAYPYRLIITREYPNGRQYAKKDLAFKDSMQAVVDEMNQPSALNRANRVERVARKLKRVSIGILLGAAAFCMVAHASEDNTLPNINLPSVAPALCSGDNNSTEVLAPIADNVQKTGQAICSLANCENMVVVLPALS